MYPLPKRSLGTIVARARGLTLVETLLATTVSVLIVGALGGLVSAVYQGNSYGHGYTRATQHGRVALERIERAVREATTAPDHPGVAVLATTSGPWRYPDTLVVWHPSGAPANPAGPPLAKELLIICPDPDNPFELVEITVPNDTTPVPLDSWIEGASGRSTIETLKRAASRRRVVLTNLLRAADPAGSSNVASYKAAVWFDRQVRPSADDVAAYRAGTKTWDALPWPQGLYSATSGVRRVWLRTELQLMPEQIAAQLDPQGQQSVAFFGSAELYDTLQAAP